MSHGGGGGGFGHGGGMHHGGNHHGGGEPDSSASWNMAYVGEKRSGKYANFNPFPIFLGLFVFSVMILPFVLDWNEPHLQRILLGHDPTPQEIAHRNAVDQILAGMMKSRAKKAFGDDIGGAMIADPSPQSGAELIAEPDSAAPAQAAMPAAVSPAQQSAPPSGGGMSGFSISADTPPQQGYATQSYAQQSYGQYGQQAGLSQQMAPGQTYLPDNSQMPPAAIPPTVGFGHQRFVSQPPSPAYRGGGGARSGAIDYRAPRHKIMVER